MANVELSLSETFHKHKRNLVLLCSAIAVLRIASPAKLKLPFVGTDVDLPSSTAFIMLGFALAYMFAQYYIEYRTMLARHAPEVAGAQKKTVDEVIESHLQHMQTWTTASTNASEVMIRSGIDHIASDLTARGANAIVNEYLQTVREMVHAKVLDHRDKVAGLLTESSERYYISLIDEIRNHLHEAIKGSDDKIKSSLQTLRAQLDDIERRQQLVAETLSKYANTYRDVAKSFNKLSSNIGPAQRIGFQWIDGYLVIGFAALALAGCVTGALGWWIEPPTPVVGMPWFPSCLI